MCLNYKPLFLAGVLLFVLWGCGGDDPITPGEEGGDGDVSTQQDTDTPEDVVQPPEDVAEEVPCENDHEFCESFLCPGDNVQEAINGTLSGGVLCLGSGTFTFSKKLEIPLSGVQLLGAGSDATILDFSAQTTGGPSVSIKGHGCVVENLQILNGADDGIYGTKLIEVTVVGVKVLWDSADATLRGRFGIRFEDSSIIRIRNCEASGAREAGVQLDDTQLCLVSETTVTGNTIGVACLNVVDTEIRDLDTTGNAVGAVLINTPDGGVVGENRIKVNYSSFGGNNGENVAPSDSLYRKLPSGTGIALVATDTTELVNLSFDQNGGLPVALFSFSEALFEPVEGEGNRYPWNNYVHVCQFGGNGEAPAGLAGDIQPIPPVETFVWDGCLPADAEDGETLGNCFDENQKTHVVNGEEQSLPVDFLNFQLCAEEPEYSYDIGPFLCQGTELPSIEPGLGTEEDAQGDEEGDEQGGESGNEGAEGAEEGTEGTDD